MSVLHRDGVTEALGAFQDVSDPILSRMERRAAADGFPTVGPEVGSFLAWLVESRGIARVFECGSGFGYSAYWIARAMPPTGEIVLTERDEDELVDAQAFFEEAGLVAIARFEAAEAIERLAAEPDPFDLVLLDHENERYLEGFRVAERAITDDGVIVADNVLHSWEFEPGDVASALEGAPPSDANPSLSGIAEFLAAIRDHPAFWSTLLPIGEGVSVSMRRPELANAE